LGGRGGMVSVSCSAGVVGELLSGWEGRLSVAAFNGPASTVVSGEPGALAELLVRCEAEGVRARRIEVDYASHGEQVEEIRGVLAGELAGVVPRSGGVPFYSSVTGGLV
ncbi:acyltransferase domain-containing protein, partial [Streptomyces sp. DT171]|uniref:acyltransferase domain-containing protein n=1 Tax=Streptomyces sp. DT171 TaxID=3416524 RepID=UPI003CE8B986